MSFIKTQQETQYFPEEQLTQGRPGSNQKFEQAGEGINSFYYDMYLFKTSTGRLLFFWVSTDNKINYSFSDNRGISWIKTEQITGFSFTDLSVTEIEPDKIILSFSTVRWSTRLSTDNGETWIEDTYYKPPSRLGWSYRSPQFINLSGNGDSLLAIYSSTKSIIYSEVSTDRGNTWSDTTRIIDTRLGVVYPGNFLSVKTVRDKDENIWLIYDRRYDLGIDDYNQKDVSALISTDNGITWQERNPFTSYLGNDYLTGVTTDGDNILVCFNSSKRQSI